jgi:hypothetical protein
LNPSNVAADVTGGTSFNWSSAMSVQSIPVALAIYSFLFDRSTGAGTRDGLALVEYLSAVRS